MKEKSTVWLNIKRTWRYARKYKKQFLGYVIFSILLTVFGTIMPTINAIQLLKLTNAFWQDLLIISILIFVVEMSRNVVNWLSNRFSQIFFRETTLELQVDLATKILDIETKALDRESSGVFSDRLNKDAFNMVDIFTELSFYISETLAQVGILFAVLFINVWFFLFFLFGIIILFIVKQRQISKVYAINKELRELGEKNTGLITELVRGMRDIKVLNAGSIFINKIRSKLYETNQKRYSMTGISRRYQFYSGSLQDFLEFLFIILAITFAANNWISVSSVLIIYMYEGRIFGMLGYFSRALEEVKKFDVSANRVYELTDGAKYPKETFGNKKLDHIKGSIDFKNVTFAYDEKVILNDVSFTIKPNQTIAFVGKSGGGKTTIFNLIARLYNTGAGEILIDGVNINELDEDTIRNNIAIITQNPYIFNFSIRDNFKIVKDDLTDEEMFATCKLAALHDYILTLPDGYDTVVGEGGLTLSGGQRQRLAIARALLKKSKIILFDEATSALDNETQTEIQKAINNISDVYTIIIIAHRLSTIINADNIFVLENGQITESGTHIELMQKGCVYKSLYDASLENKEAVK